MRRYEIEAVAHTTADAATVYALLRAGATWPTWSTIDSFELEREGAGEPEGGLADRDAVSRDVALAAVELGEEAAEARLELR